MAAGVDSLKSTKTVERGSDIALPPNPPLSAPATIGATIVKEVLTIAGTTNDGSRARSEGPYTDDA